MIIVTGAHNPISGTYRMHAPTFPYLPTTYIGYTEKQMKAKYRLDFGLRYKHIDWIIV